MFTAGEFGRKGIHLQVWDATTLKPIRELKTAGNLVAWNAGEPVFSPDSRRVLMLRTDQDEKLVTIWDLDDAKGKGYVELRGHQGASTRRLSVATENAS